MKILKKVSAYFTAAFCVLLIFATAAVSEKLEPTIRDVAYGPHERNVLDFWRAESETPAPLVIYIHGGGFQSGSKEGASGKDINKCLENGVSFVSINYPFYRDVPLVEILRDNIARAVQFTRYRADDWNIDGEKIAVYGESAGAGSSLWLAFHDDLADPESGDPVLRESTRVSAAGGLATQATYDFLRWPEVFDGVIDRRTMKMWQMMMARWILDMYHAGSGKMVRSQKFAGVRREMDMLSMMDGEDPPVFLRTLESRGVGGDLLHHPRHAEVVKERCGEVGIECLLILDETPEEERIGVIDFFFQQLGIEPGK